MTAGERGRNPQGRIGQDKPQQIAEPMGDQPNLSGLFPACAPAEKGDGNQATRPHGPPSLWGLMSAPLRKRKARALCPAPENPRVPRPCANAPTRRAPWKN